MTLAREMLDSHPEHLQMDAAAVADCVDKCYSCAETCAACADACLGEEHVKMLARCIRLNEDCADVCVTTGRMLSRQTQPDWDLLREVVRVCASACQVCGQECRKHADEHAHCRICADACDRCEQSCNHLLRAMPQT